MQAQLARGIELDAAELAIVLIVPRQLLCIQHVCLQSNNGLNAGSLRVAFAKPGKLLSRGLVSLCGIKDSPFSANLCAKAAGPGWQSQAKQESKCVTGTALGKGLCLAGRLRPVQKLGPGETFCAAAWLWFADSLNSPSYPHRLTKLDCSPCAPFTIRSSS